MKKPNILGDKNSYIFSKNAGLNPWFYCKSLLFLPHSYPWGVSLYAVRVQDPYVKDSVNIIALSGSQLEFSFSSRECRLIS